MVILLGLVGIVNFLIVWELVLRVAFTFHTSALKMWSSTFEAWSWLVFGFYLIYWSFRGMELSLWVALGPYFQHQQHGYHWSNLTWFSKMYFSVPLLYLFIYLNLGHTPQCNGLDHLSEFETCPSYDESLTKAHLHDVSTFWVAEWGLFADEQKLGCHDCQRVFLILPRKFIH